MAQTGYTPILIYSSSTASQAPAAGNLTNSTLGSELAINITDGKLFYKDNANAVQVIGWKTTPTTAGGTGLTSYTAGDLLYYASGTALTKLAIGTSGRWLGSSGTAPQWNAPAALTKTDDTNVTLTLGGSASTALLNAASLTLGWTGQLAVTRGGTGLSTVAQGDILYGSASNTLSALAKNTTATRYLSNTGTSNNPAWAQVDLTNGVTGTLPVGNGGTGATTFTAGRILFGNTTSAISTSSNLFWDSANNRLGLGTSSPAVKGDFQFTGGANTANWLWVGANSLAPTSTATYGVLIGGNYSQGSSEANIFWGSGVSTSQYLAIGKWSGTAYTEQTRMTYDGSWLCGTTNDYGVNANGSYFAKSFFVWANDNTGNANNRNWNAGVNGYANGSWELTVSGANNSWPNAAYAFAVTSGGACYNTTGTYGTMSDVNFKENIADARDYVDDLMKVRVVKYSLKQEESSVATKLGVIAQEVEQIFPGLIDVGSTPQGEEFKSVKMTVFVPMLIKAIQELKREINALKGIQ